MPAADSSRHFDLGAIQQLLDSACILLTPNQRLARRIKSEWDRQQIEKGLQSWQPVAVYSLENWLAERWRQATLDGRSAPGKVLTALQQGELWRQLIQADALAHGNYSLLRVDAAAELARQARDNLIRACVPLTAAATLTEFRLDTDCATFLRWMRAFEQRLAEQGALTAVDCVAQLLELAAPVSPRPLALLDFDDIPPLYRAVLGLHASAVQEVASGVHDAAVIARSFPDRCAELNAVAAWAADHYAQNPQRPLGIVLADMHTDRDELEYLLRRAFDCLGDNYTALPVDFSTGITLDQAPVVRDALRMLSLAERSIPMQDVLGLLQTRFSSVFDAGSARSVKMLQQLFADGSKQISSARLRQLAATVSVGQEQGLPLGPCLLAVNTMRLTRKRCLPSQWVDDFCAVLQAFGWPGTAALDSLEYQQVEAWYGALETLAGFDAVSGELDYGSALALLRRCCQGSISQPKTAASPIQVLGPLEGAGLQFDQLWLCGLQASRWPAPARPNPFIPMALQQRFAMPHSSAEREWHYASTLMNQYRAGSETLIASYCRQIDGVPELPSPLLQALPIEHVQTPVVISAAWLRMRECAQRSSLIDNCAPAVAKIGGTPMSGGSGVLQAQANCPFRAFAGKRLFLEPLDDYHAGLSAAQRGSLLHDALYVLWGDIGDSDTLQGMDESAVLRSVNTAVAAAVARLPAGDRQRAGMHCLDLEQRRLATLVLEWLQVERSRDRFRVVAREQAIACRLGDLSLSLRVDRVDELADGSRVVIDYKSGRSAISAWLGERPAQPQLPLYGLSGATAAVAFAQVRARDCKILGLGEVSGIAGIQADIGKAVKRYSVQEDWAGLVAEWERNLTRLADQFLAGDARVEPLPGACNYCGMQPLCRVELDAEADA